MKKHLEILKDIGLTDLKTCSNEESEKYNQMLKDNKPLPDNVYVNQYGLFHEYEIKDCSQDEIYESLLHGIFKNTKIIKGCVIFFTVLMAIAIVVGIIAFIVFSCKTNSYHSYY